MSEDTKAMAVHQIPDGSWVSGDGRWVWRDVQWIPMPIAGQTGIFWFTSTPGWWQTLLLMGLIGLIPFAGAMDLYGYAIVTARNIRAGYRVLPPANFNYIGIGAPVAVLQLASGLVTFLVTLTVGGAVGFAAYGQTHSFAWAIGLGIPTGLTVVALANLINLPLFVPALEMSERESWGVFRVDRLFRHTARHWRAAWYGAAIFLLWYLIYFGMALAVSVIPFGGILAAVAAMPVLAPMIATPIARFNDPPVGFSKVAAYALAAGWLAFWLLWLAVPWTIGIAAASIISGHPEETACVFSPGCTFRYSGNLEAIAHVHRDATRVTVDVTYINRSSSQVVLDPAEYAARTYSGGVDLLPSADCPAPEAVTLSPGERLDQRACFNLPTATNAYEVHLPVIGWDANTA